MTVGSSSDEDLLCLAAESSELSNRRIEASQLQGALEDNRRELR